MIFPDSILSFAFLHRWCWQIDNMANLRNTLFASSSMGSYQLSCFHFVSSEVFPQLGGFGSEALEKQLGIRMICHQFEPIEVLASDQALQ